MTLPAFSSREREQAKVYLATTVTAMMGRKFEEEDWAKVYAAAKGFRASAWSNFDIDVMQGNLGVEHKMYSQSGASSLLECCGRSFMHPAGTRAIRIPVGISDATEAAQDILRQYGRKIEERTSIIRTLNRYHHDRSTRESAIDALVVAGMSRPKALSLVPEERSPTGSPDDDPDMRFGWLLWRRDLAEFLYFEERMVAPDPSAYFGEWHVRQTSGRRLPSRSLWVFRRSTNIKEYSITTDAGAKVQPYFTVPAPRDPNLYHFCVQGERVEQDLVRVWLSADTAQALLALLGSTSADVVDQFVRSRMANSDDDEQPARSIFEPPAVPILIGQDAYRTLRADDRSVSDEHAFRRLLDRPV